MSAEWRVSDDGRAVIRGEDEPCIAVVVGVGKDTKTVMSYAHLISAAPNLLAAAQSVVDRWDSPAWKDQRPTADAIDALRKAIAKATA